MTNERFKELVHTHLLYLAAFLSALMWFQIGQSCAANAKPVEPKYKIAIIDTGYDSSIAGAKLKLCQTGHYDFRVSKNQIGHTLDHGTYVASIVAEQLKNVDYCAVILQVRSTDGDFPIEFIVQALHRAAKLGVVAVNYSFDGPRTSVAERESLRMLVNRGVGVFVAAGNSHKNLDYECDTFPVCHEVEGMNTVGALDPATSKPASYSNRGSRIKLWYSGDYDMRGVRSRGTSFASPRALADYVQSLDKPVEPTTTKLQLAKRHSPTTNTPISTTTFEN